MFVNINQARYNKSYSGDLESSRRTTWEENLITIYKHNMMAAAGHHSYTLKDNHIADLGTRQYIRDMVIYIYMNDSKNFEMYKSIMIDLI